MPEHVDALILDLLEFVVREERPYHVVMEAWRTSCPRLPVWEEANESACCTHSLVASTDRDRALRVWTKVPFDRTAVGDEDA